MSWMKMAMKYSSLIPSSRVASARARAEVVFAEVEGEPLESYCVDRAKAGSSLPE
jgi:hypothetical protein